MKGLRAKKSEKMKFHGEFSVAEEEINPLILISESAFKEIQRSVDEKNGDDEHTSY
ncbi:hypothetical protein Bca101_061595 [Brassica carinata]